MPRALLSVTDKTGIVEAATRLVRLGFDILSTGGTARALSDAGLKVTEVGALTGFGEILDGRVKSLHPAVHGGLLADTRLQSHRDQLADAELAPIEVLIVNLYAFESTVTSPHSFEEAIESIDIGGPAMLRAAAKNHENVVVLVDPDDYGRAINAIESGSVDELRVGLAAKAFRHTAYYDSMVSRYISQLAAPGFAHESRTMGYRLVQGLRYGENPHQEAALYADPLAAGGIATAKQLWGKELSYNNILDADAALGLVADLPPGSCAVIKHGNPCGAAVGADLAESFRKARSCDPVSAFGGIAAFNQMVDIRAAEAMAEKGNFLEVVVAPSWDPEAVELLSNRAGWGQDVRLLEASHQSGAGQVSVRSVGGGALIQTCDFSDSGAWTCATTNVPSDSQLKALRLAWAIVAHVKSNAIVVCSEDRLLGIGAGQSNRVQSVRLALDQAGPLSKGAVLASDAFFPFPDSVEAAAQAQISAIVQPGGSKKDKEVIETAENLGIVMMLTGVRHFRH